MIPAAPRAAADKRGLTYPFGGFVPEDGALAEVADGVFWFRLPLPFTLDHINLYVLDGGDHWAVIDTGLAGDGVRALWEAALAGPLNGRPVGRVIVTHYHPDHLGQAGWLTRHAGAPLEMTRAEFMLARTLTLDQRETTPPEVVAFYARAGWDDARLAGLALRPWGRFAHVVTPLPIGYQRLRDGDALTIGARTWRVVTGGGHSPEHACLMCDADKLLLAGDQVLPRITSNVSVYPTEPLGDPLGDWLDSIEKLRGLPDDLLVLPSHGEPFTRLHARLDQLAVDHADKLERLHALCARPSAAVDAFGVLFHRPVRAQEYDMATGEALAHLHWLERRARVARVGGAVDRFVAV